jgi:hypothetical protein
MEDFNDVWAPPKNLTNWFTPTRFDRYSEIRKADIKNYNLPILQYWFNGSTEEPIKCLITGMPAFVEFPDIGTGQYKMRFVIDFNHIRQMKSPSARAGISVDKTYTPSAIIRESRLDEYKKREHLLDLMTTIPVHSLYHSFITQDSAKSDIILLNFKKDWWPWGLQSKTNFNEFCKHLYVDLDYKKFVTMLSDINAPPMIRQWRRGLLYK